MTNTLNSLTKTCTAFPSWEKLAEAMEGGYVPTLIAWPTKSSEGQKKNQAVTELRLTQTQTGPAMAPLISTAITFLKGLKHDQLCDAERGSTGRHQRR